MGKDLKHEHVLIRAEVSTVPGPEDGAALKYWMKKLIRNIGMTLLNGPHASWVAKPGNVGWTCVALIETSHVVIHIWNEPRPHLLQFDVYSCADLDLKAVLAALDFFDPTKVEYKFVDREHEFVVLDHSTIRYTGSSSGSPGEPGNLRGQLAEDKPVLGQAGAIRPRPAPCLDGGDAEGNAEGQS